MREPQSVTGHDLVRMSAKAMAEYGVRCEVLEDLQGHRCPNPKCIGKRSVLGGLEGRCDVFPLTSASARYKCRRCGTPWTVHHGNPMFGKRDLVEVAVYSWWMFIQGASLTLTALHTGRSEDLIRRYYHQAILVCAFDAECRQARMKFGGHPRNTRVLEVDGTRICKFKAWEDGKLYYYHNVILGVAVRGQPTLLWLLDVGLTRSAERSRVPPESLDVWMMVMNGIFEPGANLIQMSDTAAAFQQDHPALVEKFSVNHQEKEWTKPVRPIWDVVTKERRACLASSNYLDSVWKYLKSGVPDGIKSTTAGSRKTKFNYVRAQQWRQIVQEEDRWEAFCAGTSKWRSAHPDIVLEEQVIYSGRAEVLWLDWSARLVQIAWESSVIWILIAQLSDNVCQVSMTRLH